MSTSATPGPLPAAPAPYKHQCAAMGIKANSRVVKHEASLGEQSRLDFTLNYIGGAGLQAATDAISRNVNLETLILVNNGLNNESVVALCRSIRAHPALKVLDLSQNPISLPAGLALIELVRGNQTIREIRLAGTLIDETVQAKLRRLININRAKREKQEQAQAQAQQQQQQQQLNQYSTVGTTAAEQGGNKNATNNNSKGGDGPAGGLSMYQRVMRDHERQASKRREEAEKKRTLLEQSAPVGIAEELKALGIAAPPRGRDGWAVVDLFVSTAPHGFVSELKVIHDVIVPKLNKLFAARKVCVVPFSMYHGVPPLSKEKQKQAPPRLATLCDHYDAILRAAPLFVQIVGDKVGLTEFIPTSTAAGQQQQGKQQQLHTQGDSASNILPKPRAVSSKHHALPHLVPDGARILARELALAPENSLRLVFRRASALGLGVPTAIISTVSDDPAVVYPDPQTHAVKVAVAKAQGIAHPRYEDFDYDLVQYQWKKHLEYKTELSKHLPRPFLVDYTAKFETIDALGQAILNELQDFEDALLRRLKAALEFLFPLPTAGLPENASAAAVAAKLVEDPSIADELERATLQQAVASQVGRKGIAGKLDLYTVTPPSRNMALVTCTPGAGASTAIAAYVLRSKQKPSYLLASHSATNPWLCDQPSDLRSALLHLAQQLSKDGQLPTHVTSEVDIVKIKQYFASLLATTTGDAGDNKTVIVVLDGIDDLDSPVLPCRSLRVGVTGADEWDPPLEIKSVQKPLPAVTHRQLDSHDWIPICLSRNQRFVVSAQRGSEAHQTLELRGHDSCDAVPLGDLGDNDVESIVMREAEALGVHLRDEELAAIRSKPDARTPEYLLFVLDYVRRREETTQFTTRLTGLSQLPGTVAAMCTELLNMIEAEAGASLARALISLLCVSRWGLHEFELRSLLRQQSQAAKDAGAGNSDNGTSSTELLNGELYQKLVRLLRPVLTPCADLLARTGRPVNALHSIVHLRSRAFRAAATQRYLADDASFIAAHHQLGHHYRRLMRSAGPFESKAVREFPYHVVKGEMWSLLESSVASIDYVSQAYLHRLGYEALRELVRAYNFLDDIATERHERTTTVRPPPHVVPGLEGPLTRSPSSSVAKFSDQAIEALKLKLREYCYFVKEHNVNLVQYPHMVRQIAIACPAESCLHQDARGYFRQLEKNPHFVVVNKTRAKLHAQAITGVEFAPTGLRVATGSDDRTVKICGLTAEPLITISQGLSKITKLCYSGTSRYIAAACQDRSLMVIDATGGALISRPAGHTTTVKSIALSARGRYVFSGGEDRIVKVWDSESGVELLSVSLVAQSHHTSSYGAINAILPHPSKEEIFYAMTDRKLLGYKLAAPALDRADELVCLVGHKTLPLASCHLADEAAFAVTTARDLALPASHFVRQEDNIKIWSLETGRCLATLSQGVKGTAPGYVFSVLSPDERILAAATFDGGLDLHRLDWRSYAPVDTIDQGESVPMVVTPFRTLSAFREHPTPTLTIARFSFDSKYVAALGNQRQLKVWRTDVTDEVDAAAAAAASEQPDSPSAAGPSVGGSLLTALSAADRTVAEYLMDQPGTCMDWTLSPAGEGGELMVGDAVGKLHALQLKR